MKILFISLDSGDLWKYEYFREVVKQTFPSAEMRIVCGERKRDRIKPQPDVEYVLGDSYRNFMAKYAQAPIEDIIALHQSQAAITYSSLYRGDLRFVYGMATERELALEQAYLVEQAQRIIQEWRPEFMFMTGGGQLMRTSFFVTGKWFGVHGYRISPAHFLNPNSIGLRHWFMTNQYGKLSSEPNNKFNYDDGAVHEHAERLINSVRHNEYRLDVYGRSVRWLRSNFHVKAVIKDIRGAVSIRQRRFNRESEQWRRLASIKNYTLNSRFSIRNANDITTPFFIFPLNIYDDTQLILRAPQFVDLLSLGEQIANVLPFGHKLVIKEHPAHLGMLEHDRLKAVLKKHPNIIHAAGDIRMADLLPRAAALVTINNTSGFEALVNDVPVVLLGDVFYKHPKLTYNVENPLDLKDRLTEALADEKQSHRAQLLPEVIADFIRETVPEPGVIVDEKDNGHLKAIAEGIVRRLEQFGCK